MYPKSAEVLKKANLKPLRHYIQKRRHTVYGAISSRPVLEECKGAVRLKGSSLRKYWWDLPMEAPKEEDSRLMDQWFQQRNQKMVSYLKSGLVMMTSQCVTDG